MKNIEKYYDNTEDLNPNKIVKKFIEQNIEPNSAIELGCGAGRDSIYLIKNGWKVLAIDKEDVKARISKKLNKEELKRFRFSKQNFESLELECTNLLVANFSLGNNDEWKNSNNKMTFLTKDKVIELFKQFNIISFKEFEKDGNTALGEAKHWHIFFIIAKKK